uniref:Hexose transporter 1 n=1 Tax=Mucochytrium quahogii TaxID=96639 RepID=A0A7S2SRE6_9STRA|mmetsp:Transcript_36073/g.57794  ORF Transcript_36073/g.57794 Transcript_36073/m.57794 type:complete len:565 (+) Transcript_36073:465-2159(+)
MVDVGKVIVGDPTMLEEGVELAQVLPALDLEVENDSDKDGERRGLNAFTVLVLVVGVLGGLLFGLDLGTAAITSMDTFRSEMGIPVLIPGQPDSQSTVNQLSLFQVLFHVFTILGAPFAGQLSDRFGRKPLIVVAIALFFAGALWQSCAGLISHSFAWTSVLLGRCLGGIGNGFILTIMPVYAAELSPAKYRGKVLTLFQFNVTVGIFVMALINKFIQDISYGWRIGFAVRCVPCVLIFALAEFMLPESPRYLLKHGRVDAAYLALMRLSKGSKAMTEGEIKDISEELKELDKVGEGGFEELFQGAAFPALICGFMVAFSQNVTGNNWFMNYATQLFSSLGFDPFVWDLVLKVVFMIATLAALFLVERFGRKFLTVWGTLLTILIFLLVGLVILTTNADVFNVSPTDSERAVQWFTLVMIFAYIVVFAVTWGPLAWLIPAEVFPIRVRGKGMSLAVVANMLTNIILGDYGYNSLNTATSLQATCMIIVGLNVFIVLSTAVFLQPETKGVSLEDMRKVFGYERHGNTSKRHGTMHEFYKRNFDQTLVILRCRSTNPKLGFNRFDT